MRLYMVRRTRGFIKENYAQTDPANGRRYLLFSDGERSYFPDRLPKKVPFKVDDSDPNDLYAKLYAPDIVDLINHLDLPRYGLGTFVLEKPKAKPTADEDALLANLYVAGNRFVGALADRVFVAHAAPASRTLALCEELRASGKTLYTVDDPANGPLLAIAERFGIV